MKQREKSKSGLSQQVQTVPQPPAVKHYQLQTDTPHDFSSKTPIIVLSYPLFPATTRLSVALTVTCVKPGHSLAYLLLTSPPPLSPLHHPNALSLPRVHRCPLFTLLSSPQALTLACPTPEPAQRKLNAAPPHPHITPTLTPDSLSWKLLTTAGHFPAKPC